MNRSRHTRKPDSSENSSFTIQQGALMTALFLAMALTLQATQPGWWTSTGGPLNSNPRNDYQVVNQGQLKQFTKKAVQYMDTNLRGGAGTTLDGMVTGWSNYYATNHYNSSTNRAPGDFKAVNAGQLKYIGKLIWSQLVAAGYTNTMPSWASVNTNTDYMVVNAGQLKTVFNFDVLTDTDTNGLPDWWETYYFGGTGATTGYNTNSSPTGNGLTLLQDYHQGNNPTNYYSQNGGIITPTIAIVSGNGQTNAPGGFTEQPLVVSVVNSAGGAPLTNAPVTFNVASGGGGVGTSWGGFALTSTSISTGASGHAQAFYLSGTNSGVSSSITATTAGHTVTFSARTSTGDGTFDAPSNITASSTNPTEIDLAWVNHASTATGILIQNSTDNAIWTTVGTLTDPTATTYAATNMIPGQAYYFRILGTK